MPREPESGPPVPWGRGLQNSVPLWPLNRLQLTQFWSGSPWKIPIYNHSWRGVSLWKARSPVGCWRETSEIGLNGESNGNSLTLLVSPLPKGGTAQHHEVDSECMCMSTWLPSSAGLGLHTEAHFSQPSQSTELWAAQAQRRTCLRHVGPTASGLHQEGHL